MIKYFMILLFCFNILLAEQNGNKASELEMFLFKIGFDDILKDVEVNKEKSSLNEKEIKALNEKIELIMNELYQNKRVLLNDTKEALPIKQTEIDIQKEMQKIRSEITFIKQEIETLKNEKAPIVKEVEVSQTQVENTQEIKTIEPKTKNKGKKMRVATEFLALYSGPDTKFEIFGKVNRESIIEVEYCRLGWCKIVDEKYYVREFLIKPYDE